MPQSLQKIMITRSGGPEVLDLQTAPPLTPASGEALVAVKAAGLNFADLLARQGLYPDAPPLPTCMGYEFSGVITEVGNQEDKQWVGKSVFGLSRFQAQATQVCVPLHQLFEKPPSLSFEQAAAIPVNYLTAWQLLVVMGALQPSETVLIHNAGGGVGLAAIEIAHHIGANIIGTSSPSKHPFLKERGVDHCVDYRNQDWSAEIQRITQDRGVELVIDPLGGNHWQKSYEALRSTGRLGMFGISTASKTGWAGKLKLLKTAAQMPFFHPISLMNQNKAVFGVNMGRLWHEPDKIRLWMQSILEGVAQGWINPHIDQVFTFHQAAEAHRYLEERRNKGKVVLIPE